MDSLFVFLCLSFGVPLVFHRAHPSYAGGLLSTQGKFFGNFPSVLSLLRHCSPFGLSVVASLCVSCFVTRFTPPCNPCFNGLLLFVFPLVFLFYRQTLLEFVRLKVSRQYPLSLRLIVVFLFAVALFAHPQHLDCRHCLPKRSSWRKLVFSEKLNFLVTYFLNLLFILIRF